jgi:hypothetical protein
MIFLTTNDFDATLGASLKKILVTDNTSIQDAENYAISEARSYLSGRFDVANIFSQTGSSRNPMLIKYIVDLTIYAAQSKISPQNIPAWCKQNRDEALSWFKMVANNELNPDLPLIPGTKPSGTFRFGGAKKITKRL